MARFHGLLGFVQDEETSTGVWEQVATEHEYVGDILRNYQNWEPSQQLNDDVNINNTFSLVADEYAYSNLQHLRYISWNGNKWKVKSIEIKRPRLILTVGGVYNG